MGLPVSPLPTTTVNVAGVEVEIRSLSRAEALKLNGFRGREDEAEVFILSCGTGVSADEASAWRESVDTATAGLVIDGILVLSGLAKDTDDPNPETSNSFSSGR